MNIDEILKNYQIIDNDSLIEYIQNLVKKKSLLGEWDRGLDEKTCNLTTMLMYEYATSIEKLTEGNISAKNVVDKLFMQMGKLRYGDFKKNIDDIVKYDSMSVTSDDYKKQCRVNAHFGAHAITYNDSNNDDMEAIVLFDDTQKAIIDKKEYKLSGIDLNSLSDIRGTIFHEWTHVMERCNVRTSELSRKDIIYENGNSTYINTRLNSNLSKDEYEEYVNNVDELLKSNDSVQFIGISTIEINYGKNSNNRIMHSQISEGATEYIARKVMQTIKEKVEHPDRYAEQVKIVGDVFEGRGLAESLTTYFTEPYKLIRDLENQRVNNKDMLHYISDYINSSHISKIFSRCKIDKKGNVKSGTISKISNAIKNAFNKKNTKLLPEASERPINKMTNEKSEFIERLKVNTNMNKDTNDWKCPVDEIDSDIRDTVKIMYKNNIKPYMSCSGSYKDHKDKPYLPETACIEMLDSKLTRELLAMIINDNRFKCSISKENEGMFYDNELPNGLRFKIEFENICGNMQEELMPSLKSVIEGKSAEFDNKNKIDMVCSLINAFDVSDGKQVKFSFNDEMIKEDKENYSIEIQDKKDFEKFGESINHAIDEFTQDENKCKMYGNDFLTMLSILRKIRMDYYKIPELKYGKKAKKVNTNFKRVNKFTLNNNEKIQKAKEEIEQDNNDKMLEGEAISFMDIMNDYDEEK